MNTRLFFKPVAALFVLVLMAASATPSTIDAKASVDKAADKTHELWSLLEKGDVEASVSVGESALEYTETAARELSDLAEKSGSYERSYSYVKDARDWLSQTVKDAKAKDVKEAYYHSIKALAAINHARDDFPK